MNRNVESHFATLPSANIQRSTFDMSFSHKTTFNVGDIIPIFCQDVLPGDTFQVKTNKVVRLQTLLAPLFDNIYLDTYYFFVPTRLTWDHWREFMGESTQSPWLPLVDYAVPRMISPHDGFEPGTIADYFGIPVGVQFGQSPDKSRCPISLPFRALALICNEFFRDENLSDPLNIPKGDANDIGINGYDPINGVALGGKPYRAAKFHDYFTSALPAPQRGDPVNVPVTGRIPVYESVPFAVTGQTWANTIVQAKSGIYPANNTLKGVYENQSDFKLTADDATTSNNYDMVLRNLWADGSSSVTPGTAINFTPGLTIGINDLRLAVQSQKYFERLAIGGNRYTEQILSFFGVKSPDARLQRPEYLGGNRIPLNIHEVTNTAQSEQDFLGDLGAMSVTGDSHADFIKSFTEHGYVIGVCVARYDHTYSQGLNKMWLRGNKFDYYFPVFANIGEQPIDNVEIYADFMTMEGRGNTVFGYQEAWASYRYKPNYVTGAMRPGISNTFAHWSLADNYNNLPVLSDSWIREDKTNVDRALAVTSSLSNQIFADFYFDFKATRPMPMWSIPGLIDHF